MNPAESPEIQGLEDLKELATKALESKGVLGTLRATIRANLLAAIDAQTKDGEAEQTIPQDPQSQLLNSLVYEYLEFHSLDQSLSVFIPETNLKNNVSRQVLMAELGINKEEVNADKPLLQHLVLNSLRSTSDKSGKHN
mmetsp:Transcript_13839/g.15775  ORF Transcript_13839/g.15775 Transcript_13839/m.15775 type:complete len:139 (-) Transcript_13839:1207-1623(-)